MSIVILLFGPSQTEKSTFTNNFLDHTNSNLIRAQVGTRNGESVTIYVKVYTITNISEIFPQMTGILHIIDVPELFDSGLSITQEEILNSVRDFLFQQNFTSIDGILLFESMEDDTKKLMLTMEAAVELFGPNVKSSAVVLSTKWEKVEAEELVNAENCLNSLIGRLGLSQHMKWQSNYENKKLLSREQMHAQILELFSKIKKLQPYSVQGIRDTIARRDQLAEELRDLDPQRYVMTESVVTIDVPEVYFEDVVTYKDELVPLSEEEIKIKATILYDSQPVLPAGLVPHPTERETKIIKKQVPVTETKYHVFRDRFMLFFNQTYRIPYQEVTFKEIDEVIDVGPKMVPGESPKHPIEYFANQLKGEKKSAKVQNIVKEKKIRIVKKSENKIIKSERYALEHYQNLARKKMKEEFIKSVRT